MPVTYRCTTWKEVQKAWRDTRRDLKMRPGEEAWYRGVSSPNFGLSPGLMWQFDKLSDDDLDRLEQNLFYEFQARARQLHERGLSDWDYLFFMRHHGVPTRLLDWTDSFGMALYFAHESTASDGGTPCVWVLNPYALNRKTWDVRDLVQPKYLGYVEKDEEFWDYGELINSKEPWFHEGPVAIYPLQISERMRSQRGWFTMFGNVRDPLDVQYPEFVARIEVAAELHDNVREFLAMAGIQPYAVYPDLDHLGVEVVANNAGWIEARASRKMRKKK